ncbi:MAG: hypothetical protein ACRDQH_10915 [Pseudonocardiaceae bacterium]
MHTTTSAKRNVVRDSAAETTHDMISALRDVLLAAVTFKPAAPGATASTQFRACAVLYLLLCDHSVDQRGRCRSCRRSGGVLGLRRRLCRVHVKANYWLHQPVEFLNCLLARELGLTDLPPAHDSATHLAAGDLGDTDVLSSVEPDFTDPRTTTSDPGRPASAFFPQVPRGWMAGLRPRWGRGTPRTPSAHRAPLNDHTGRRTEVAPDAD